MKHLRPFLLILIALLMCLCCVSVLAADYDLSGMSDGEVTALLEKVNQEISERGIEKTAKLAKGTYIAGKDIPAGSYVYTCLAVGEDWGNVTVYSEGGSGDQLVWEVVSAPEEGEEPETIYMTLNDGDQLKSGTAFSLTIVGGIRFQ